jgi:hypothetical protein
MNDPRPLQNRLFAVIAVPALLAALMIIPVACAKTEGEGGLATIRGRVLVKEYNSTFTVLLEEYYGYDEDVFITFGDGKKVDGRERTTYDGWFEFRYLRPGNYKVYAYSKDSSLQTGAKIPVIREVTITGRKEMVELEELVIFK